MVLVLNEILRDHFKGDANEVFRPNLSKPLGLLNLKIVHVKEVHYYYSATRWETTRKISAHCTCNLILAPVKLSYLSTTWCETHSVCLGLFVSATILNRASPWRCCSCQCSLLLLGKHPPLLEEC